MTSIVGLLNVANRVCRCQRARAVMLWDEAVLSSLGMAQKRPRRHDAVKQPPQHDLKTIEMP
jgi:hypothetical protein